jgi:hypothetical protein
MFCHAPAILVLSAGWPLNFWQLSLISESIVCTQNLHDGILEA